MKRIADLEEQERKALNATARAYDNFKRKQSVLLAVNKELEKLLRTNSRARRRATAKGELAKLLVRLKSDLPT